jgi:hypothetical protein
MLKINKFDRALREYTQLQDYILKDLKGVQGKNPGESCLNHNRRRYRPNKVLNRIRMIIVYK